MMGPKINPLKKKRTAADSHALATVILATIFKDHSIIGEIKVQVIDSKAILRGVVETQQQKDAVTATVLRIEGISEVENNIYIDWMC